ncbi:MAG TPA: methyltransferase domain-containing protein [Bryobacteraceae bacterium]|jgi:ubiquinone/menaquinone biosynthesis C-methylase UbiE|nr:methyltransferase domain-containing protein [Bryobacteraceae bacterium]
MPTNYDEIADQYKRSKQFAWRYYIEQYSLRELLGDVSAASVLDLACGDGHYTRMFKNMGASRVVGVDISPKMIELARAAEKRELLGVSYLVGDASSIHFTQCFDVVCAAYLLNYARSEEELFAMAKAIHRSLNPGGRFVAVNNNPNQQPHNFGNTRKYGFVKETGGELRNGLAIHYRFFQDDEEFVVENYHLDAATHVSVFRDIGFSDVRWRDPLLAPSEYGAHVEDWADFLRDPPIALLTCIKRESPDTQP